VTKVRHTKNVFLYTLFYIKKLNFEFDSIKKDSRLFEPEFPLIGSNFDFP